MSICYMSKVWSSDISLWTVWADNTCFLRDKLFSADFMSEVWVFFFETPEKKRFRFWFMSSWVGH